jgi:hypothetical protein
MKKVTPPSRGERGFLFSKHFKRQIMKTYIVKEENVLKIIQVRPELDEAFHAQYAGKILFSGDSIQDVLIQFGRFPVIIESPE